MGMWYNISGDLQCYDIHAQDTESDSGRGAKRSVSLPGDEVCTATVSSNAACWDPLCCNEDVRLVNTEVQGVGNDMFWPPSVERGWTYTELIESAGTTGFVNCLCLATRHDDPLTFWSLQVSRTMGCQGAFWPSCNF